MSVTDARSATAADPQTAIARFIEESRRLIGQEARDVPPGTGIVDWLNTQRFIEATGDENPLYNDANYGALSANRVMQAPPTFVLAVRTPNANGALYQQPFGFLNFLTSAELEWDDQVYLGNRLSGSLRVTEVRSGHSWRGRPTAQVVSLAEYRKDDAAPFARARGTVTMYPIRRGGERFIEREIYSYSDEEIAQLEREMEAEAPRRGRVPRFWDGVSAGDQLPPMVKGPLTLSDLMVWAAAEAKPEKLGGLVHKDLMRMPGRMTTNPSTNWPYWDFELAREDLQSCTEAGFPGPYGREVMRIALAGHLITDWMGDDGFLRRLSVDLPAPFIYGDTMRLTGRVRDTFTQQHGGRSYGAVEVEIAGVNQLGETILSGSALVYLPRPGRHVVLPIRA